MKCMEKSITKGLAAAAVAAMLLTGCGAGAAHSGQTAQSTASRAESMGSASQAEPDSTAHAAVRMDYYRAALETLLEKQVLPDGTETGYNADFGEISDNLFDVCDVDNDGRDELLICWSTGPTAGMVQLIYDYDAASRTWITELSDYPAVRIYTSGLLTDEWSHNHGLAGDKLWPYTIYRYDAAADAYTVQGYVDAWDKKMSETSPADGSAFPADVDADGDGVVYLVTENGETSVMDGADYSAWHEALLGSSTEVEINYSRLTAENIAQLG